MSQSPKVRSDSFWGDLANALALAPVYREPKPPLAQSEVNQMEAELAEARAAIERISQRLNSRDL